MLPSKVINIRLSAEQAERFEEVRAEFGGLPKAAVLRLMISSFLDYPREKQVEMITRQIRGSEAPQPKSRLNSRHA
jgi:hypothetical protein